MEREQASLRGFQPSVYTERPEALGIDQGRIILGVFNPKQRQKEKIDYLNNKTKIYNFVNSTEDLFHCQKLKVTCSLPSGWLDSVY